MHEDLPNELKFASIFERLQKHKNYLKSENRLSVIFKEFRPEIIKILISAILLSLLELVSVIVSRQLISNFTSPDTTTFILIVSMVAIILSSSASQIFMIRV